MRYIDRKQTEVPSILLSKKVDILRRQLLAYVSDADGKTSQRRANIDRSLLRSVEDSLSRLFEGRCAYCESDTGQFSRTLEAHRPLGFAADPDGTTHQTYYAWLAYDWDNMLLVCKECMLHKENRFFVDGKRGPLGASVAELRRREQALLLDPCFDEPAGHLSFFPDGRVGGLSTRGNTSIRMLSLNRLDLVQARAKSYRAAVFGIVHKLETMRVGKTGAKSTWSSHVLLNISHPGATSLALLQVAATIGIPSLDLSSLIAHLTQLTSSARQSMLGTLLDVEFEARDSASSNLAMDSNELPRTRRLQDMPAVRAPIASITIKNFKALQDITFKLPKTIEGNPQVPPCMVILGENATGKSSVLEAITLALLGTREISELARLSPDKRITPAQLIHRPTVRHGNIVSNSPLSVTIDYFSTSYRTTLSCNGVRDNFEGDEYVSKIILAYGPRRYFTHKVRRRFSAPAYRVRSLFDPLATIPNPSDWLLTTKTANFDAAVRALREILMLKQEDYFERENGFVVIETLAGKTRLEDMSVGYKAVIAMATDIMQELMKHYDNLEFASAIVLIDEIETHLHPRWKMRIIGALRRAFPRVQFILTTHDPLCLRGVYDGEAFVLQHREDTQTIEQLTNLPPIRGMRAEQILTSEFFGLGSTDPETEAKLAIFHHLASKTDELTYSEQQTLKSLREDLQQHMVVGDTLQEQAIVEALKQAEFETRVGPVLPRLPSRDKIIDRALHALRSTLTWPSPATEPTSSSEDNIGFSSKSEFEE